MENPLLTGDTFKTTPIWTKQYFVVLAVGILLYLVGLGTDYWVQMGVIHFGLWRHCYRSKCEFFEEEYMHEWMLRARQIIIAAGLLYVVALVALTATMQTRWYREGQWQRHCISELIFNVMIFIAGVMVLVTAYHFDKMIVYPSAVYLSWHITVFAGLFTLMAAFSKFPLHYKFLRSSLKQPQQ